MPGFELRKSRDRNVLRTLSGCRLIGTVHDQLSSSALENAADRVTVWGSALAISVLDERIPPAAELSLPNPRAAASHLTADSSRMTSRIRKTCCTPGVFRVAVRAMNCRKVGPFGCVRASRLNSSGTRFDRRHTDVTPSSRKRTWSSLIHRRMRFGKHFENRSPVQQTTGA